MINIAYLSIGLMTGIVSGLFGIGGATIMIPALVFFFHFTQHQAQGTSLAAMIPPVGLLAALTYYKAGHVNLKIAGFIALGFFIGGFFGGFFAQPIADANLKKLFGIYLIIIGVKYLF
ncbi:MAG: permease [Elusimicrobia bacterium RIFOXYD2_FULL_34_15]|nr:MAG: permease [Elusimicrobia bacterium RIFOXYD2_FULL_34_15]